MYGEKMVTWYHPCLLIGYCPYKRILLLKCLPLKVATVEFVAFLVPAECLSTKTFSSSCFDKFGKMACCGLFLLLLLSCLLVERSMPGEKLT